MPTQRVRRSLFLFALFLTLALLSAGWGFRLHLQRTVTRTAAEVRQAGDLLFTLAPLRMPANPGFAPVLSSGRLGSVVVVDDASFVSASGALFEFKAGVLVRTLQAGIDLPGVPLVSLSTGRLHHSAGTQVFILTAGAGLLLLDPASGGIQHLLPADASLRDLTSAITLPDGDLLLGTRRRGVLRFDGETLRYERPEWRNLLVTCMLAAANGDVWIGTQADGLYLSRAGVIRHFESDLPDPHIETLAAHGDQVLAATAAGVVQFGGGAPVRTLAPGVFVHALAVDDRELTLGTIDGDTLSLPLGAGHARIAMPGAPFPGGPTEQFLRRPDGLYALRGEGLFRRTGATWTSVLSLPGATLTDSNIAALGAASDGRLWVGYFDRGLDILPPALSSARHLEDDHLFCINRIAEDPVRGTVAVATANGLVLFDRSGTPRQVLGTRDGLISEHVTDLAWTPGASGLTLTLATPAGLTFLSREGAESLYAFQGLVNNHVYSVAASADGRLVAGTLGGLSVLEHAVVRTNLTAANSALRGNWISAVRPLPAFAGGGFLLGTYGRGLMQLTADGRVVPLPGAPEAAVINPNALLTTPNHLLAGTLGQGLWSYGRLSGRWTAVTAGLPSASVTALAARDGEIFVGTDNGLVRIAEARLPE